MKQKSPKKDLNQLYRDRYKKYRAMGYTPDQARKLRHRSDDESYHEIPHKTTRKTYEHTNNQLVKTQPRTQRQTERSKTVQSQAERSKTVQPQTGAYSKKQRENDISRIRYQIYRDLGYSAKDARKLRHHTLDVKDIKISDDGHIQKESKQYKEIVTFIKTDKKIETYREKTDQITNDTVYSRWGMLTQDKRYRDNTAKMVKQLQRSLKITNDQAYYMLYYMMSNKRNLKQAKRELLSSKEFEIYRNRKERGI